MNSAGKYAYQPGKTWTYYVNLAEGFNLDQNLFKVVKIDDIDMNLCCGVHMKNTLDLRVIKIKKFEKYKKATRIEFLCGTKAIEEMLKRENYLNKICKLLSSNEEGAYKSIENLNNKIK